MLEKKQEELINFVAVVKNHCISCVGYNCICYIQEAPAF